MMTAARCWLDGAARLAFLNDAADRTRTLRPRSRTGSSIKISALEGGWSPAPRHVRTTPARSQRLGRNHRSRPRRGLRPGPVALRTARQGSKPDAHRATCGRSSTAPTATCAAGSFMTHHDLRRSTWPSGHHGQALRVPVYRCSRTRARTRSAVTRRPRPTMAARAARIPGPGIPRGPEPRQDGRTRGSGRPDGAVMFDPTARSRRRC